MSVSKTLDEIASGDEPLGAAHRPSGQAVAEYAQTVHDAHPGHPVTLFHPYEQARSPIAELDQLCEMHPIDVTTSEIFDDGMLRITRQAPFCTRMAGEIDFTNRRLVRKILDKELDLALRTADKTSEIQVHLESLRFADVMTIAQFVRAAERFPRSHTLVLYGVRPGLRRVLDQCGAGFAAQLTLREADTA